MYLLTGWRVPGSGSSHERVSPNRWIWTQIPSSSWWWICYYSFNRETWGKHDSLFSIFFAFLLEMRILVTFVQCNYHSTLYSGKETYCSPILSFHYPSSFNNFHCKYAGNNTRGCWKVWSPNHIPKSNPISEFWRDWEHMSYILLSHLYIFKISREMFIIVITKRNNALYKQHIQVIM